MSNKVIFFSKDKVSNLDYVVSEYEKLKWSVSEKKVINSGIEVTFVRSNETKELLEADKEYELLTKEYDELIKLLGKILDNEFHGISKGILFICFIVFSIVLCFLMVFMMINPEEVIFVKVAYGIGIASTVFLCYKLFDFFFLANSRRLKVVENKFEIIKMKKHNVIAKLNNSTN
ncbi:MAG: hypothetical protein R3Y60_00535 [bacterium]